MTITYTPTCYRRDHNTYQLDVNGRELRNILRGLLLLQQQATYDYTVDELITALEGKPYISSTVLTTTP